MPDYPARRLSYQRLFLLLNPETPPSFFFLLSTTHQIFSHLPPRQIYIWNYPTFTCKTQFRATPLTMTQVDRYILLTTMLAKFTSLAAVILGGWHGWHAAAFVTALIISFYLPSVSVSQATACIGTLLVYSQLIYRTRLYLTPPLIRQRRIHLLRKRPLPQSSKMAATFYYQLQRPLQCHHQTCWAAAAAFPSREKKGPDGLSPFMRQQWALAAPGIPRPDMEEVLATLNVTPAHHFERLVCWVKESWESLPRTALLVVSAILCVLVVRPASAGGKFLSHVDWTRLYVVVGILVCVWFCGGETVERAPAPRYEKVVSYYLVPEVRAWCKFSFLWGW